MRSTLLLLMLLLQSILATAQTLPTLPNTAGLETCFPDTSGYSRITVGPVGRDYSNLQAAINAATPGTVLLLDAGATFTGSFKLPNKTGTGWIILQSARMDLLPAEGTRIDPAGATGNAQFTTQQAAMPKIVTTNLSGLPCLYTQASAHHYRFVGLELRAEETVLNSYGLLQLGDGSSAQNNLNLVPHDLIVDRCYIHGHDQATIMKAGVLLNCARAAVLDSWLSQFHSIGYDTYAIGGTNGPGPFIIRNNYLEAAGENVLFGGAAPAIAGLVPSDIEIRNNYFFKPFSWRVGHPSYAGKHWTIKNLFELKTGKRVLFDGNILENCWADLPTGQSGYAILLTVRAENGAAPQADVSDITITNNLVRHAGAGISLSGHDSPTPSLQSKRIRIANNLFDDIDGPAYGDGNTAGPNDGIFIKLGDPADVSIEHNTVLQSGAITWAYDTMYNVAFRNNIFHCFVSDGGYQGIYGPGFAQGGNGPLARYFPDITDANQRFHRNVLIGGPAVKYNSYNTLSTNYFPATAAAVQFVNYNGSDYHGYGLSLASPYKNMATDGTDPGVNLALLDTALLAVRACAPVVATQAPAREEIRVFPNPFVDRLLVDGVDNGVLVLRDVLGREMGRFVVRDGELMIGDGMPGVYLYVVFSEGRLVGSGCLVRCAP